MKVYLVNDCFRWSDTVVHYGCKAIIDSFMRRILKAGHEIIGVCTRPLGPERDLIEEADMLIVNGEGTFRDEAKNFEPGRHDRLFDGLSLAKDLGKSVYLTNTVWCRMSDRWGPLLRRLDGISTREPESARQIQMLCGRMPEIHPDEAFFLPVPMSPRYVCYHCAVGDFYENVPGVSRANPEFSAMPHWGLLSFPWNIVVQNLRGSQVYITGQHHGVYAACKARCPFAACRVNTHKLTSLFEWAGVNIPLATTPDELRAAIGFAMSKTDEFNRLFDFLEEQTSWPIPVT